MKALEFTRDVPDINIREMRSEMKRQAEDVRAETELRRIMEGIARAEGALAELDRPIPICQVGKVLDNLDGELQKIQVPDRLADKRRNAQRQLDELQRMVWVHAKRHTRPAKPMQAQSFLGEGKNDDVPF